MLLLTLVFWIARRLQPTISKFTDWQNKDAENSTGATCDERTNPKRLELAADAHQRSE